MRRHCVRCGKDWRGNDMGSYESRDFGMPARLSDHHAAVRVTDQDRRTYLLIEDQIGRGHVALQRNGRILDDADVETVLLEDVVEASPARAVDEGTVNQNDIVDPSHGVLLEGRGEDQKRGT